MKKLTQKSLEYKVYETIAANDLISSGDHIIVALSGGADSICLLKILLELKDRLNIKLSACHFNHRIRGAESDRDEEFVKKICQEWGIPCLLGSAPIKRSEKISEETARDWRYGFFEKILQDNRGAKIAIAHNSDDLFETFLLALIRGSGLRGLRSIPLRRENFIRPLLYAQKKEILQYLGAKKIEYVEDSTNADPEYARNFVRSQITPLLLELNPNLLDTISNTIEVIEKDYDFITGACEAAFSSAKIQESSSKIELSRDKWVLLHPALRREVLRYSIAKISDLKNVTLKQIKEAERVVGKGEGRKYKKLPSSLRIELLSGKIIICKDNK